jgi:hypothetical protein
MDSRPRFDPTQPRAARPPRWPALLLATLAAATSGAACSSTTEPVTTFWEATLQPALPATVGGRVAALTRNGRTQITISIEGAEADVPHMWRLESGTCAAPGTLEGGVASYPVLTAGPDGSAEAEASIAAIFRSGEQFAARVVWSPEGGAEEVVACGDLVETT